ncbi:hypothetical protein ASZ90_015683 [hydrocarbon metagenome]|uniref:Uncharacterized protein n=1 Tax=hydrocarbon metagenome TaxID=938273 RepID=A0A0W8F193_9ZZZZ
MKKERDTGDRLFPTLDNPIDQALNLLPDGIRLQEWHTNQDPKPTIPKLPRVTFHIDPQLGQRGPECFRELFRGPSFQVPRVTRDDIHGEGGLFGVGVLETIREHLMQIRSFNLARLIHGESIRRGEVPIDRVVHAVPVIIG